MINFFLNRKKHAKKSREYYLNLIGMQAPCLQYIDLDKSQINAINSIFSIIQTASKEPELLDLIVKLEINESGKIKVMAV